LLKKAAEDLELVVVPAGSALYKHGAKGDYLYVVEAGTLDVMAPNPSGVGTPRVIESVGAGAVVGDVALTFAAVRYVHFVFSCRQSGNQYDDAVFCELQGAHAASGCDGREGLG
jgi:CRP-like cAMP-binding protein